MRTREYKGRIGRRIETQMLEENSLSVRTEAA